MNSSSNAFGNEGTTPVAARVPAAEPASPLSENHFLLLRQAAAAREPIRVAANRAKFSAQTILVIGALSMLILLFSPSGLALFVVAGICAVGVVEYVGSRYMRQGQLSAGKLLGTNQLALMALIVAYCLAQMLSFSSDNVLSPELQSQLSQLSSLSHDINSQIKSWAPLVNYGFYSLVIVLTLAVQGSLALYYFTRTRQLQILQQSTPAWVRRLFAELGV